MGKKKAILCTISSFQGVEFIEMKGVKVDETNFKRIVGSLMYLTATRPDIMYVVSLISRFMSCPTELHLQAAKKVLRYLRGTVITVSCTEWKETETSWHTQTVIMQVTWRIEKVRRVRFL